MGAVDHNDSAAALPESLDHLGRRAVFRAVAPSRSSRACLIGRPPPYPVSDPSLPITRWHGTTIGSGLRPFARPTARTAVGRPMALAMSPYVRVRAYGIRPRAFHTAF